VHHEFAFSGLLRCGSCGRAMVGEIHAKPNGKRYVYYRCHRRGRDELCGEPTLPERLLVEQVSVALAQTALTPDAAAWVRENLTNAIRTELGQLTVARESIERALQQARTEEETLLSLRLRGSIDDSVYEQRRVEIASRRAQLEVKADRPSPTVDELLQRVENVVAFAQHAPRVFREGTAVQQRQIMEAVGSNYRVIARKALYEAKKPFTFLVATASRPAWYALVEDVRTWLLKNQDCYLPEIDWPLVSRGSEPRKAEAA
jgi:hypothetical protein